MEENKSIEQVLENLDKNIVYKTKDSIVQGSLLFFFGLASFIIYSSFEWESNSIFSQILFVVGSVCLIVGIFKFFFRKSHYVSAESHRRIKSIEIYFHINERDKLVRLLQNGNFTEIEKLNSSKADGLKLRVIATDDGQICYSQVVAFITNEYINVTPAAKHSIAEYQNIKEIYTSRK